MSSVLDEERRDAFLQALQSLQEEQQEADRREREEKKRQEDQLRHDIEEARRLRAENEEHERRRLEEERARREVDYGIDRSPTSNKLSHARQRSSLSGPLSSQSKRSKAVIAAPSLTDRTMMILSNLRGILENMSSSFRSNPMLLMRMIAFIVGILLMFSRKSIRERLSRILGTSWNKIRATAGMGVKVSYI
jgi:hypothetical protein